MSLLVSWQSRVVPHSSDRLIDTMIRLVRFINKVELESIAGHHYSLLAWVCGGCWLNNTNLMLGQLALKLELKFELSLTIVL